MSQFIMSTKAIHRDSRMIAKEDKGFFIEEGLCGKKDGIYVVNSDSLISLIEAFKYNVRPGLLPVEDIDSKFFPFYHKKDRTFYVHPSIWNDEAKKVFVLAKVIYLITHEHLAALYFEEDPGWFKQAIELQDYAQCLLLGSESDSDFANVVKRCSHNPILVAKFFNVPVHLVMRQMALSTQLYGMHFFHTFFKVTASKLIIDKKITGKKVRFKNLLAFKLKCLKPEYYGKFIVKRSRYDGKPYHCIGLVHHIGRHNDINCCVFGISDELLDKSFLDDLRRAGAIPYNDNLLDEVCVHHTDIEEI